MKPFTWLSLVMLSVAAAQGDQGVVQEGAVIYSTTCLSCHQATGQGIEGAFPALAGNTFVTGEASNVVQVLLDGRGGMPSFSGQLSDSEISAVASYIRSAWGNEASGVTPEEIMQLRSGGGESSPTDPNARPGAD